MIGYLRCTRRVYCSLSKPFDVLHGPDGGDRKEMSHLSGGTSSGGSTSAHSDSTRRAHPRPLHVNDQAAGSTHRHHSRESLFGAEQTFDEAGEVTSVIANELKEMQSRVWWRRPSALWYVCLRTFVRGPLQPTLSRDNQSINTYPLFSRIGSYV